MIVRASFRDPQQRPRWTNVISLLSVPVVKEFIPFWMVETSQSKSLTIIIS